MEIRDRAAMGSKPIPSYANNFMAKTIDPGIKKLAEKYNKDGQEALALLKRFLDDYFSIFIGTTKMLHQLFEQMNQIHPSIWLNMNHTSVRDEDPLENVNMRRNIQFHFWIHCAAFKIIG